MARLGGPRADGQSQDEAAVELTRHQVDLPALVDPLQQLLVQLVGALRRKLHSAVSESKRRRVAEETRAHNWLS